MKFAKKYYLVNEQQYKKGSADDGNRDIFVHPSKKVAIREHGNMERISADDDLTDYEKVVRYSQSLQKYLKNIKDAMDIPKRKALLGEVPTNTVVTEESKGSINPPTTIKEEKKPHQKFEDEKFGSFKKDVILSQFKSKPSRKKVETLLTDLDNTKRMTWDENSGEVIIDGDKLDGSNITQLLKTSVGLKGADKRTREWVKFNKLLRPQTISASKKRPRVQTGNGVLLKKACAKWHCLKE